MTARPRTLAVFFDAGSTLIDPARPVIDVYGEHARALASDVDPVAFRKAFLEIWPRLNADFRSRHPDLESSDELERMAWHDFTRTLAAEFQSLARQHSRWLEGLVAHYEDPSAWRIVDGAEETLRQLQEQGIRLAVVSNWHRSLDRLLERCGIARHFDFILTSAEAGRKKPHQLMFETAVQRIGVEHRSIVHVGDSWEEDVEGACAAKLRAIHFCRRPQQGRSHEVPMIQDLRHVLKHV